MTNRQGGFTLIEALIALSGFLVVSTVCLMMAGPLLQTAEKEEFFTILKADLYYGQLYAISHQRDITVNIMGEDNLYYIRDRYDKPLLVNRGYPGTIKVSPGSMPLYFKYLLDGNVSRFGSFFIETNEQTYRMTILIGKGRFYVAAE